MSMASSVRVGKTKIARSTPIQPAEESDSDSDNEGDSGLKTPRSLRALFPVGGYFRGDKDSQTKDKEKDKEETELERLRQQLDEERRLRYDAERLAEQERTVSMQLKAQVIALQAEITTLRRQLSGGADAAEEALATTTTTTSSSSSTNPAPISATPRSPSLVRDRLTRRDSLGSYTPDRDATPVPTRSRTRPLDDRVQVDADGMRSRTPSKSAGFWRQLRSMGSVDHITMQEKIRSPDNHSPRVRSQVSYFESLGKSPSGWLTRKKKDKDKDKDKDRERE